MDRMLFMAMSGAKQALVAQAINNNNMANASTPGFKADLEQFRAMPLFGDGHPSRVFAMTESPGLNTEAGPINVTGHNLDVAVKGEGWLAVQGADGNEAYTRMGNLSLTSSGVLVTGSGYPVIGNGGPITLPPNQQIEIGVDGTISIKGLGEGGGLAVVNRIKLVNPERQNLKKGEDGLIHLKEGDAAEADGRLRLEVGSLEMSNVNPIQAMVEMIELQRHYEMQVKVMKKAEENDSAVTQLMKMA